MSKAKGGKGGAIVNTASILGMQPLAGAPVYAATKYFVIGLTKSYGMDYHYRKSNVKVMAICPGITRTPLIAKANKEKDPMAKHAAKELNALPIQEYVSIYKIVNTPMSLIILISIVLVN